MILFPNNVIITALIVHSIFPSETDQYIGVISKVESKLIRSVLYLLRKDILFILIFKTISYVLLFGNNKIIV